MKKSDFDSLLERYLKGTASHAEQVKIEAWLDSRRTSEERNSIWTPEEEDKLFQKISSSILDSDAEPVSATRRFSPAFLFRAAAGFVLLIAVSWMVVWVISSDGSEEYTTDGKAEKIILKDATIVWLSANSKLRYKGISEKGERMASLEGEGIFEVAKDAQHPFVIQCQSATVKVLGTSFHLKTIKDNFSLEVFTGKVNVASKSSSSEIIASPQERVLIGPASKIQKESIQAASIALMIKKTEYDMSFDNIPMDEIIARLERKFNVRFSVQNSEMRRCRITADLTDHSLARSMEILSELIDVSYKIDGSIVAVSGAGCQTQ